MTNFSHKTGHVDYRTPEILWKPLHGMFNFTWDLMASDANHLFPNYFSLQRSLMQHYRDAAGQSCFSNPAWGRGFRPTLHQITRIFLELARDHGSLVCALLPASLGNRAMHDHVLGWAEILQLRGRPTFDAPDGSGPAKALNKKKSEKAGHPVYEVSPANFDIMFAIWEPGCTYRAEGKSILSWDPYGRANKHEDEDDE